jgi:membrane associated rhomboid family serine protease
MALRPRIRRSLRDRPAPTRLACIGAISAGVIGAITGLILGLASYPPTAWFAVLEVGLPAATAGAVVGFVAGLVITAARRIARQRTPLHE